MTANILRMAVWVFSRRTLKTTASGLGACGRLRLVTSLVLCLAIAACADGQNAVSTASGEGQPSSRNNAPGVTAPKVLAVTDADGKPIVGAMVSFELDDQRRVTRFTNTNGLLPLDSLPVDSPSLLIRYPGMTPVAMTASKLDVEETQVSLSVDPGSLQTLPSSHWLSLLPDGQQKREFILNCGTCHEISHDRVMVDGRPRTRDEWMAAIAIMRAMDVYEVIPPDFNDEEYAQWLAENLSAERVATLRPQAPDSAERLSSIEITEYELPLPGSLPHDLVNGPDGRIWITGFLSDELWALSPESGVIERFSVDDSADVNAQPRALEFDAQGILWLVNGGTESVLRFDPSTGNYKVAPVAMYAHSIDLGPDGGVWVNDYFAAKERLAHIDAESLNVSIIPVPPAGRPDTEGLPLPYGLQVDSVGRVYSTQLAANTLARYDSRTKVGTLFEMPVLNSGPRRPGLDADDRIWIPEFNTGSLALFDPGTEKFSRVQIGSTAVGLYDVEVNQANGDVWATGSLASTLIRYQPDSGEILTVPMPTEPAYTRHISVDEATGDVWSAYSSLPAAQPKVARIRFLD